MLRLIRDNVPGFEFLAAGRDLAAVEALELELPKNTPDRKLRTEIHEAISEPLQRDVASGARPSLILISEEQTGRGRREAYLVEIGKSAYLMVGHDGDETLQIFPAIPKSEIPKNRKGLEALGESWKEIAESLYGNKWASLELQPTLALGVATVQHASGSRRDVRIGEDYGRALWQATTSMIHRAVSDADLAESGAPGQDPGSAKADRKIGHTSLAAALPDLVKGKGQAFATGPIGDRIEFARSYKGMPVVVTSYSDKSPITVFVEDRKGEGAPFWFPVAFPPTLDLPTTGMAVAIVGKELRIMSGLDADGRAIDRELRYDLEKGRAQGFPPDLWRQHSATAPHLSFGAMEELEGRAAVVGGAMVEVEAQRAREDAEKLTPTLLLNRQRQLLAESMFSQGRLARRDPPPAALVGATTAAARGALFVGPGDGFDGAVYAYDATAGGVWYLLDPLPGALGLGQLYLDGSTLVYAGGYSKDGGGQVRPSKAIYTVDLDQPNGGWSKAGESDYVTGDSKLLNSHGRVIALMVAGGNALTFYPGLLLREGAAS